MNSLDAEINGIIMQEIGLEIGVGNRVIDQDTGVAIQFKGRNVVAPGFTNGRNTIEFDPVNNSKMMDKFFGYFLDRQAEEGNVAVSTFYNIDDTKDKGAIECRMTDESTIKSGSYSRESLKYADIIIKLNGGRSSDLSKYDVVTATTVKRGKINGNKSNTKTARNRK